MARAEVCFYLICLLLPMVITNIYLIMDPCKPVFFSYLFCAADGVSNVGYTIIACVIQSIWLLVFVNKYLCSSDRVFKS